MSSENSTVTGRTGKFVVGTTQVAKTTKWDVNPTLASSSEWGDSDSGGFTNRRAGRKDCTFNAEGKYSKTASQFTLFKEGDTAIAVLWMNATLYWDFPCALCDNFTVAVDIDSQEVIGWTSAWGADGAYYRPGDSGATARTLPT